MDFRMNKMCRICLKEGDDFKSLFLKEDVQNLDVSLPQKILACSSVQVIFGDGLPHLICEECRAQVDIAYEFREKCLNTDATLRKYISIVQPFHSFTDSESHVQIKPEDLQSSTNEDVSKDEFENEKIFVSSEVNKRTIDNIVDSSEAPLETPTKKKKRVRAGEKKAKKANPGKKCKDEEGGSDNDKKKRTKEEKDVKCPICKKTFAYLCILKDHMVQHTGAKPYLCSACGKSFGHTASLTNHMKTHYSDKPHKCDRCELSFHRRAHLVLHIRTHTGEKPYVCDVCGRDFAQSSYLKEHMRVHSGEKPFVCDICGHGFARKSCLVMHRRVHTGELPYACPECGRAFSQRSQRKRHVKRNHKGSACLRATGELILKDLDLKNKNSHREGEVISENSVMENSISDNSLSLPQDNSIVQRDTSIPLHPYQADPSNNASSMIIYQQDNMASLFSTPVMPLPLIQIQTTLLQ